MAFEKKHPPLWIDHGLADFNNNGQFKIRVGVAVSNTAFQGAAFDNGLSAQKNSAHYWSNVPKRKLPVICLFRLGGMQTKEGAAALVSQWPVVNGPMTRFIRDNEFTVWCLVFATCSRWCQAEFWLPHPLPKLTICLAPNMPFSRFKLG